MNRIVIFDKRGNPPQKQANKKGKILPWTTATPKLTAMSCWLVNHYLKNQKTNKHEKKTPKKTKNKTLFSLIRVTYQYMI